MEDVAEVESCLSQSRILKDAFFKRLEDLAFLGSALACC